MSPQRVIASCGRSRTRDGDGAARDAAPSSDLCACQAARMTGTIAVAERGRRLAFSIDDLMRYHGHSSPGGVAHAFKVLERALPLLDPDGR